MPSHPRCVVAFVRHGHYEQPEGVPSAHLPHPLTEQGRQQAAEGIQALRDFARELGLSLHPIIDSSRMLRAWETAQILAEGLAEFRGGPLQVEEFDALAERCVGAAANLSVEQIAEVIARDPRYPPLDAGWKLQSDFRLPLQNAESLLQAGARVAAHTQATCARISPQSGDTLKIVVGHGGAFRHAAIHLGVMALEDAPRLSMYHCRPVLLERLEATPGPESATDSERWQHLAGDWKIRQGAVLRPD